MKGLAS